MSSTSGIFPRRNWPLLFPLLFVCWLNLCYLLRTACSLFLLLSLRHEVVIYRMDDDSKCK